ncbi:hypothetical protein [Burkholderia pseudomallei]|uniref:hypothetical protein n=1 Tax=Burkholderia pseudomallei TaxID=28450 RepID=UPI0012AEC881|nr:hypothetical protein [Burkholderia pseudomallei]MBF3520238.1 hypothetical protein [Burkholderia pseudomallei]MBF3541666.1 hypothetical protein [Burkholderia pseudomallei]MBF3692054.1 hypothetical protein [Burkholderia pseudomallei]MBF3894992.1 hypothetical protein [Burkholderia pseudomallei]
MLKIVLIARVIERVESNVRFDARIGKDGANENARSVRRWLTPRLRPPFRWPPAGPPAFAGGAHLSKKTSISLRRKCANSRFGDNPVDRFECALSTAGTRPPVLKRSASVHRFESRSNREKTEATDPRGTDPRGRKRARGERG